MYLGLHDWLNEQPSQKQLSLMYIIHEKANKLLTNPTVHLQVSRQLNIKDIGSLATCHVSDQEALLDLHEPCGWYQWKKVLGRYWRHELYLKVGGGAVGLARFQDILKPIFYSLVNCKFVFLELIPHPRLRLLMESRSGAPMQSATPPRIAPSDTRITSSTCTSYKVRKSWRNVLCDVLEYLKFINVIY